MMDKLVPPLFELLKQLDSLEQEIFARDCEMGKEKFTLKIPANQIHPKWPELVREYKTRCKAVIEGRVSEKLLSCGYAISFGSPSAYYYLNSGEYSAEFTMRKETMASVVTYYKKGVAMKQKFVLRLIDGAWLIDEVYYGFWDEKTWHSHHI